MDQQLKTLAGPFEFQGFTIHTATNERSEVLFNTQDIAKALDLITDDNHIIEIIPDNWKAVLKIKDTNGNKDAIFVNEPGFYFLCFNSDNPIANDFANWANTTVVPEYRNVIIN